MLKINEYIESGVLEAYVLGAASEAEAKELLYLKEQYPQVKEALLEIELDVERVAQGMAIGPPPELWLKIESRIDELVRMRDTEIQINEPPTRSHGNTKSRKSNQFIEVEAESGHMRIRKVWRWVFAAVFVLGKIFLAFAIYFYLENRHSEQEIERLKIELEHSMPR